MASQVIPFPAHRPAPIRYVSIDGEYFDDDLPPELDGDDDREELSHYAHLAELAHDE